MNEQYSPESVATPESLSNGDYYVKRILKIDSIPSVPELLPNQVLLIPEVLGDLEKSILQGAIDGIERSQLTRIVNGRPQLNDVSVGKSSAIGGKSRLENVVSAFFQQDGLIFSHNHPDESETIDLGRFSNLDIAYFKMHTKLAYIFLVGHISGVKALLQTSKSRKLPLHTVSKALITLHKLEKVGFEDKDRTNLELAQVLEDLNYGLYEWRPEGKQITSGCMSNGILLNKVG